MVEEKLAAAPQRLAESATGSAAALFSEPKENARSQRGDAERRRQHGEHISQL
jgi:hypothetical protein